MNVYLEIEIGPDDSYVIHQRVRAPYDPNLDCRKFGGYDRWTKLTKTFHVQLEIPDEIEMNATYRLVKVD